MDKTKRIKIGIKRLFVFSFAMILAMLSLNVSKVEAATLRSKGKLISRSEYKITLKKSKDFTHWKIRMSSYSADGTEEQIKTVKKLKASQKSYTVKDLKPDTFYYFEIIGCVKKDGKLKGVIYDYLSCFTGMSSVSWNEYASSDAPCSPESITAWFYGSDDGLPITGLELYRREEGSDEWTLLTKPSAEDTEYEDKSVEAGKTYYYRLRSYGTYNGEILYSPYTDEMELSAVNKSGKYSSTLIKKGTNKIVVKIDSEQYNGVLSLSSRYSLDIAEDMYQIDDYEGVPLKIAAVSTDGETWTKLTKEDSVEIKGGESLYLRLKPLKAGTDISFGNVIGGDCVRYNGLPSSFILTLGESGGTWMNAEMIH